MVISKIDAKEFSNEYLTMLCAAQGARIYGFASEVERWRTREREKERERGGRENKKREAETRKMTEKKMMVYPRDA